jgi:serine protease AprX
MLIRGQLYNLRGAQKLTRVTLTLCGAIMVLFGTPHAAQAQLFGNKADLFLQADATTLPAATSENVIVQLSVAPNLAILSQISLLGGTVTQTFSAIQGLEVQIPLGNLGLLALLPVVTHISKDVPMIAHDEFTVGASGADVAFQQNNLAGDGLTVAVLDSGIKSRPDLNVWGSSTSRVVANVSFVPNDSSTDDPFGHGTHVAGIVAGNGASSYGGGCFRTFYGIARRTNVANVRVMDASGQSNVSTVINGIGWVLNNKSKYNIRVMNLSMGHQPGESASTDPLCQAVEKAWKAGIVVVVAAGNGGRVNASVSSGMDNEGYGTAYGSIDCPGNDPCVITVGAMKSVDGNRVHDTVATYSSRGPISGSTLRAGSIRAPSERATSIFPRP